MVAISLPSMPPMARYSGIIPHRFKSDPLRSSRGVLYGASDRIYALDSHTGARRWIYSEPGGHFFSSPAIGANGALYIGTVVTNSLLALAYCPSGYYCALDTTVPRPCPSGAYCPPNSVDFLPCPVGFFCSNSSQPTPCPPGSHSGAIGLRNSSDECQPCPLGTFAPAEDAASCLICPEGFYCANASYLPCPTEHWCPAGTGVLDDTTLCPIKGVCIGGNRCLTDYQGVKCLQCATQCFHDQVGACHPCSDAEVPLIVGTIIMVLMWGALVLVVMNRLEKVWLSVILLVGQHLQMAALCC